MSYHSKFNKTQADQACGIPLLPVTPKDIYNVDASTHDIVDEAIQLFRANILFKNYKVQGGGDKVIIYLTCFIQKCLEQINRFPAKDQATRVCSLIMADSKATDVGNADFVLNKIGLLATNPPLAEKR